MQLWRIDNAEMAIDELEDESDEADEITLIAD